MATATAPATSNLPSIYDHPDADVVIFDGNCKFCIQQVSRLKAFDGKNRLAFVSLHDPEVARRYPDLTHEMLMDQMYVVDPKGNRYGGAQALRYLSRRLPRLWWVAPFLHVPFTLPLLQWGYKKVAERRYRLMGKTEDCENGACAVHFGKK